MSNISISDPNKLNFLLHTLHFDYTSLGDQDSFRLITALFKNRGIANAINEKYLPGKDARFIQTTIEKSKEHLTPHSTFSVVLRAVRKDSDPVIHSEEIKSELTFRQNSSGGQQLINWEISCPDNSCLPELLKTEIAQIMSLASHNLTGCWHKQKRIETPKVRSGLYYPTLTINGIGRVSQEITGPIGFIDLKLSKRPNWSTQSIALNDLFFVPGNRPTQSDFIAKLNGFLQEYYPEINVALQEKKININLSLMKMTRLLLKLNTRYLT